MTTRRGNNEGSIYQRKSDQKWIASVMVGYTAKGTPKRRTATSSTKAQAVRDLRQLQKQFEGGVHEATVSPTFLDLYVRWVESILIFEVARSTRDNYTGLCEKHLIPQFGSTRIKNITVAEIDSFLAKKLSSGLSPSTVHRLRALLSQCIDQGIRWGEVDKNVVRLSRSPKLVRQEGRSLTGDQAKALISHLETERYGIIFILMLATGLRRGEALGLKWADIDVENEVIRVKRNLKREGGRIVTADTKTLKSRRAVRVPTQLMEQLAQHKELQRIEAKRLGKSWMQTDFVFTTGVGSPIDPRNLYMEFTRACKRAGLGHWHPHELRHSAASLMLANGVKLQVVSQILGHSSIRMTADVYGHILDPDRDGAANTMASVLWD